MSDNVVRSYTSKQAQEIAGITYRQLDYWARTDLLRPSVTAAGGSGTRRAYSYRDLLQLKIIKDLLDKSVGLPQIRQVFENHQGILGEDVSGSRLVISGNEVLFMTGPDDLVALLQRPGQQALALILLEVEGIREELDGAIVRELRSYPAETPDASSPEESEVSEAQDPGDPQAGYGG